MLDVISQHFQPIDTIGKVLTSTLKKISIFKNVFIFHLQFPTEVHEWNAIADNFSIKWQFPHCLGAWDGKHTNFKSRRSDGSYYYNYKGTNSIVLLALVDADCCFTFIDVGCYGRTHDSGVLMQSDLKKNNRQCR